LFLWDTVDRWWAEFRGRRPNKQKKTFRATLLLLLLCVRNLDTNKEREKAIEIFERKFIEEV